MLVSSMSGIPIETLQHRFALLVRGLYAQALDILIQRHLPLEDWIMDIEDGDIED